MARPSAKLCRPIPMAIIRARLAARERALGISSVAVAAPGPWGEAAAGA